ncbi:MAG: hypothetical protein AB4038_04635 [Prochloraceae cyanobacterium]
MSEEIQIRDADGSENVSKGSVARSTQLSSEVTLNALSAVQAERLSLDELEARESRYGQRKPMGPPMAEDTSSVTARAETPDLVEPIEPMQIPEE